MSLFPAILAALAPPFLIILVGFGLKRLGVLLPAHVPVLNGLVIQVTLPALILLGLLRAPALSPTLALVPLALLGAECVALALVYGLGRALRLPDPVLGAILLVGVFGNTGFIGYPLTLALLPAQFPTAILLDQFGMTVPMYFLAAVVGAEFGSGGADRKAAIGRFLRSPMFLSAILGLGLRFVHVPTAVAALSVTRALGGILGHCLEYVGQGTTPLVLLALGVALRPGAIRGRGVPLVLACAAKLVVTPLAMWGLCHLLRIVGDTQEDGILAAAMPTAVVASVLCGQNDLEGDFAVGVVFVSTVLSAVTVPLLLAWLR